MAVTKVLIIDDEEKIRVLLSKIITLEGFEVFQEGRIKEVELQLKSGDIFHATNNSLDL